MDFLETLLTVPVALSWQLLAVAVLVLLGIVLVIAWVVAIIHAHASKSWRELLVTTTRVKISWIWGWSAAAIVLLVYLTGLVYLGRVASWLIGLPYLIAAVITIGIAAWLRHEVRVIVVRMQKLVQGGRL